MTGRCARRRSDVWRKRHRGAGKPRRAGVAASGMTRSSRPAGRSWRWC